MSRGMIIRLSSKLKSISQVEPFAKELKEKYNLNEDVFPKILISVTEAVNNAIIHGNQTDERKQVVLHSKLAGTQLLICVEDEGRGFEPGNVPDPCGAENMDKTGGRGVLIMRSLCDSIHFRNNGATVELIFNIR